MNSNLAAAVLLLLVSGCFRDARDSDRCRIAAALQTDPVLQQMQLSRCEQMETRETLVAIHDRERREAREREERRQEAGLALLRQEAVRRDAAIKRKEALEREEAYAEIRRNPKAPEIGATLPELAQICRQQSGEVDRGEGTFTCSVGGVRTFTATAMGGRVIGVIVFYEGADVTTLRSIGEKRYGVGEERIVGGFRTWSWETPGVTVTVGSYEDGATLTFQARQGQPEEVPLNPSLVYQ